MNGEAYRLVEGMKNEINSSGGLTAISPIMPYLKTVLTKNKLKIKKGDIVFRARLIPSSFNNLEQDIPLIDTDTEFSVNAPEIIKEEEVLEDDDFSDFEAHKVDFIHDRTVIDLDKPPLKTVHLVFASAEEGGATLEFKGLKLKECIVDSINIKKTKKLADFTLSKDKQNESVSDGIERLLSLYISLYFRDLNSNFYNTGRYIVNYLREKKFEGIAYRSRFDSNRINYILFGLNDIETIGSKGAMLDFAAQLGGGATDG